MEALIFGIIFAVIGVIMIANVIMPTLITANQTGWDSGTKAVWGVGGLVAAAAAIFLIWRGLTGGSK